MRMIAATPLADEELRAVDSCRRAADCLSAGPIFLLGDPLPRRPLRAEDIRPRLLGHGGPAPD